jgi:hypothetical protein
MPVSAGAFELPGMEALAPEPGVPAFEAPITTSLEPETTAAEALGEESLLSFTGLEALDGLPDEGEPLPAPVALEAAPWPPPAMDPQEAPEEPVPAPAVPGPVPAASGQAPLTPEQIQALLADPALMEALTKAVVARMGDQAIREIAWEVMPDLAGRLQR